VRFIEAKSATRAGVIPTASSYRLSLVIICLLLSRYDVLLIFIVLLLSRYDVLLICIVLLLSSYDDLMLCILSIHNTEARCASNSDRSY